MPDIPIVDTHLHLWNPALIPYPWLEENELLNKPYLLEDYARAFTSTSIEAMVFVQCEARFDRYLDEAAWAADQARIDPRIKAMVAWAPLDKGTAVREDLERLARHAILRGIRRIIQFEEDIDFCLRPSFVEGVRTLSEYGLSFDICIDHRHMANILRFVEQVPDFPLILDHIGKPDIRSGTMEPWASQMRELAQHPNVLCKISGVATEAHADWTPADLHPYLDVAFEVFGFERTMFGGDWPVTLQAVRPERWIALLDSYLQHATSAELRAFWRDNAIKTYRIAP
ncbi:amidohydrolase family protein [Aminobacter sp. Piv2-1]|uniref:amidohydrolase family protein n=1 Tax=Aminobacter sp. Piv2-1 TaxID=3031122 RepID=UPI0030B5648A